MCGECYFQAPANQAIGEKWKDPKTNVWWEWTEDGWKFIGFEDEITHKDKYCPACIENSVFPSLPKCKEYEKKELNNSDLTKCTKCNYELELCPSDFPWNDDFWICSNCDSTFVF